VGWGVGSDDFGAGIKEEFFESSQDIGAVRRLETEIKMLTLDSLTLREPFLSTVGHNALLRCCHPGERAWHIANRSYILSAFLLM